MLGQSTTKKDSAARVTPSSESKTPWRVASVEALPDFALRVRFNDGLEGIVEMASLVRSAQAGVFAELADPSIFNKVAVEHGVVTWPGELDLAPDAMHREIQTNGRWVL